MLKNKVVEIGSLVFLSFGLVACSSSKSTPETTITPASSSNALDDGLIGPVGGTGANGEYSQFNDSPFANIDFSGGYFYFEDFEDKVFEHPGASASVGDFVSDEFGATFHDSVDNDDGVIDGNSLDGESWFYDVAATGITWTFSANELGNNLPTHVGIVWTDGRNEITFEAFDAAGNSLGTVTGDHANSSFNGETDEDRFYGVVNSAGVGSIRISNDSTLDGIEVDHLQWGYVPE